jgi:hypothetical protein
MGQEHKGFTLNGASHNCSLGFFEGFYALSTEEGAEMTKDLARTLAKGVGLGWSSFINGVIAHTNEVQTNGIIGNSLREAGFLPLVKYPGGHGGFVTIWFHGVEGKTELLPGVPKVLPEWLAEKATELVSDTGFYGYHGQKAEDPAPLKAEIKKLKAQLKELEADDVDALLLEIMDLKAQLKAANRPPRKVAGVKKIPKVPSRSERITRARRGV